MAAKVDCMTCRKRPRKKTGKQWQLNQGSFKDLRLPRNGNKKRACAVTAAGPFVFLRVSASEKSQSPHFDALARRRLGRARGIVEGAVRGPARAAVLDRVESLEHDCLVALHFGEIIPAMLRIESAVVHFADPVGINPRAREQFFYADAARIGDRQRLSLHRV